MFILNSSCFDTAIYPRQIFFDKINPYGKLIWNDNLLWIILKNNLYFIVTLYIFCPISVHTVYWKVSVSINEVWHFDAMVS